MLDIYFAPMVGLSHFALRKVLAQYLKPGEDMLWPTEMLSSWRIPKENLGETFETIKNDNEKFICPQILGNEEEPIQISVEKLYAWGATAIDINMGCPVTKALRHNYGVALMGDPAYAKKVVEMTVRNSKVPVSVKLRAGLQNDIDFLIQFVKGLEEAGAAWVTLHPRVAGLKRRGRADWSQIKRLKEEVKIPVIGNGDVETAQDYFEMKKQTGCDGVMIGRALAAKPWMIRQILDQSDHDLVGLDALNLKANTRVRSNDHANARIQSDDHLNPQTQSEQKMKIGPKMNAGPPHFHPTEPTNSSDHSFATSFQSATPEWEGAEYGRNLIYQLDLLESQGLSFEEVRRKIGFYIRMTHMWLEFGHQLNSLASKPKNSLELRENFIRFFSMPQNMSQRSALKN